MEVFVSKESRTGKGECQSMVKDPVMYKNIWRIDNFSQLDGESYDSKLYPKGKGNGVGIHLALYMALAELKSLPPGCKIFAEFTLRILDQVHARHQFGKGLFNQASMGFVLKDTCFVKAEVTIHGIASEL
ncbi:hypothetical protein TB1_011439 [Malus domestica]